MKTLHRPASPKPGPLARIAGSGQAPNDCRQPIGRQVENLVHDRGQNRKRHGVQTNLSCRAEECDRHQEMIIVNPADCFNLGFAFQFPLRSARLCGTISQGKDPSKTSFLS